MTITVTISNTTGVENIAGDEETPVIPAVYAVTPFSMDITFVSADDSVPPSVAIPIASIGLTSSPSISGVALTVIDNNPNAYVVRYSGTVANLFNESFQFLMQDGSLQYLPSSTNQPFQAIIQWNPSEVQVIPVTLTFRLNYTGGLYENYSTLQNVHWDYRTSLQALQTLIQQGSL